MSNLKHGAISGRRLLRITVIAGLSLFILTGIAMTVFYLAAGGGEKLLRQRSGFSRSLHEYDQEMSKITGTQREYAFLNRELDRLEKMAIGVESWLSVLKRRRTLARIHPPFLENYRNCVNNAVKAFPMSQPIAAIAAESLIKNTAIDRQAQNTLSQLTSLLTDSGFNNLRLYLHIILGDFKNPQRALVIPASLVSDETEDVTVNLAILKILRGDTMAAASDIQMMLHSPSSSPSVNSLRFAAEFYYDFADLVRSAEIFSLIDDKQAKSREADALYLAGFKDSARTLWHTLSEGGEPDERSLYNLGVTSEDKDEASQWFSILVNSKKADITDSIQFGLIHYSRLQGFPDAAALLEGTEGLQPAEYKYIDLELCRRYAPFWLLERQIAETWLLLDRHDDDEDLYNWASWLFLFQRNYSEIQILLNRMDNLGFTDQWAKLIKAVTFMFEGKLDAAKEILMSIPVEEAQWTVHADLGRILEAQRSPSRALEQYELAAGKVQNPKTAARIQLRIAKCFSALNRSSEEMRALLYALDLDPDNLNARLELDRLSY